MQIEIANLNDLLRKITFTANFFNSTRIKIADEQARFGCKGNKH